MDFSGGFSMRVSLFCNLWFSKFVVCSDLKLIEKYLDDICFVDMGDDEGIFLYVLVIFDCW